MKVLNFLLRKLSVNIVNIFFKLQNQQPIQLLNLSQQRGTLPALQVTQAQTTSATTQNSRNTPTTPTGISVNSTGNWGLTFSFFNSNLE